MISREDERKFIEPVDSVAPLPTPSVLDDFASLACIIENQSPKLGPEALPVGDESQRCSNFANPLSDLGLRNAVSTTLCESKATFNNGLSDVGTGDAEVQYASTSGSEKLEPVKGFFADGCNDLKLPSFQTSFEGMLFDTNTKSQSLFKKEIASSVEPGPFSKLNSKLSFKTARVRQHTTSSGMNKVIARTQQEDVKPRLTAATESTSTASVFSSLLRQTTSCDFSTGTVNLALSPMASLTESCFNTCLPDIPPQSSVTGVQSNNNSLFTLGPEHISETAVKNQFYETSSLSNICKSTSKLRTTKNIFKVAPRGGSDTKNAVCLATKHSHSRSSSTRKNDSLFGTTTKSEEQEEKRKRRRNEWSDKDIVTLLKITKLMIDCELKSVSKALFECIQRSPGKSYGRAAEKKLKRMDIFKNWKSCNKEETISRIDEKLRQFETDIIGAHLELSQSSYDIAMKYRNLELMAKRSPK